jgi:hypothetical protein
MPMGPFDLLPGGASTLTGSQTGCGGCNFNTTFNVQCIRNQISGQFTGVPAFTVTTGSRLGGLPARTFTFPLYNSAIGSGINTLLLTGAELLGPRPVLARARPCWQPQLDQAAAGHTRGGFEPQERAKEREMINSF